MALLPNGIRRGGAPSCPGCQFISKYRFHIDRARKKHSVGCWSLRKLFLSCENVSHPYSTYHVPGTDERAKEIFVYLILLTTHKVSTFLIPGLQVRKLRHRGRLYNSPKVKLREGSKEDVHPGPRARFLTLQLPLFLERSHTHCSVLSPLPPASPQPRLFPL